MSVVTGSAAMNRHQSGESADTPVPPGCARVDAGVSLMSPSSCVAHS